VDILFGNIVLVMKKGEGGIIIQVEIINLAQEVGMAVKEVGMKTLCPTKIHQNNLLLKSAKRVLKVNKIVTRGLHAGQTQRRVVSVILPKQGKEIFV
jgi:hypothetical protein